MIHIENLVKRYGDLIALDHLNLDIKEGEIFGLLGPNGSGKSTAIGCMLALLKYDKGTIQIFGKNMTPDSYDIKKEIGVVMQNVAVFHQMSVRENVDYFCGLYVTDKQKRKKLVDEALDFVGLTEYAKKRPGKLSGGLLRKTQHCLWYCPQAKTYHHGRTNGSCRSTEPEPNPGRNLRTEPSGIYNHLYFPLYGRS